MDRTERILYELSSMTEEENMDDATKEKVRKLIVEVSKGSVNLLSYRRSDSRRMYGDTIIDLIIEADIRGNRKKNS